MIDDELLQATIASALRKLANASDIADRLRSPVDWLHTFESLTLGTPDPEASSAIGLVTSRVRFWNRLSEGGMTLLPMLDTPPIADLEVERWSSQAEQGIYWPLVHPLTGESLSSNDLSAFLSEQSSQPSFIVVDATHVPLGMLMDDADLGQSDSAPLILVQGSVPLWPAENGPLFAISRYALVMDALLPGEIISDRVPADLIWLIQWAQETGAKEAVTAWRAALQQQVDSELGTLVNELSRRGLHIQRVLPAKTQRQSLDIRGLPVTSEALERKLGQASWIQVLDRGTHGVRICADLGESATEIAERTAFLSELLAPLSRG